MTIVVAVCTNRQPAAVRESLGALRSQLAPAAPVLVTSGLDGAAVAAHRAAFDGEVLAEPASGLSLARNRALAHAAGTGAEVIAFVDDDAVVAEGWYEALACAWAEAPAEVACVGGPIRPRFEITPPAWFSPAIAHTLTLLDRGPETRDLDPDAEAVYGANISFRVGPLESVGGFDPGLGHMGRRVFFGEEDAAERALHRLGHRIRYVPDAAVWHVIGAERLTRTSFVRRRFAFGVALGMRGGRGTGTASAQLARSLAGALAAACAGRQAAAMERAVRAAENAGVVWGRRPAGQASISPRRIA